MVVLFLVVFCIEFVCLCVYNMFVFDKLYIIYYYIYFKKKYFIKEYDFG